MNWITYAPGLVQGGDIMLSDSGEARNMLARDPVFVVGSARSGTTFLGKLLDSHPDVSYRHEPDSVLVNTEIPFVPRREDVPRYREAAGRYLEALCHVSATKTLGQAPIFDKTYRSGLKKKCFQTGLYLTKAAERLGGPLLRKPLPVSNWMGEDTDDHILYVIKSVDSPWRTYLFSEAMPRFRFIHIVRHPCAVVNSRLRGIHSNLMGSKTYLRAPFKAGLTEGYPFSLEQLEESSYEERTAFLWMICNQRIYDDMAGRDGYLMVVYEDLCRDLRATTQQLFDFAGLSWDRQTERFIDQLESRNSGNAGYFNVVRSPLAALDKWRDQLTNEQIRKVERVVSHSSIGRRFVGSSFAEEKRSP